MTERFKTSTARKGGRLLLRVIDETETASLFVRFAAIIMSLETARG